MKTHNLKSRKETVCWGENRLCESTYEAFGSCTGHPVGVQDVPLSDHSTVYQHFHWESGLHFKHMSQLCLSCSLDPFDRQTHELQRTRHLVHVSPITLPTRQQGTTPTSASAQVFRQLIASSYMSVRPSVRPFSHMERLASHRNYFHDIWYLKIFQKSVEKVKVSLTPNKNNG
jgi:hypothetical protein